MLKKLLLGAGLLAMPIAAHAGTYTMSVTEGYTWDAFSTVAGVAPFHGQTATATFTYTGDLNFDNTASQNSTSSGDLNSTFGFSASNISNYVGSGSVGLIADYTTLSKFLASSGSASNYTYGSIYTIDLGVLVAGTVLTVTHDDGISVYEGGVRIGNTVSGATTVVTDTVTIPSSGDITLYYSRQNGSPSILEVTDPTPAPEPMSMALLGTGLFGLGLVRRRQRA